MIHNLYKTKLRRNKPVEAAADFAQVFQLHIFCLIFDTEKQLKSFQASLIHSKKTDTQIFL